MTSKLLHSTPQRSWLLVFETGEEVPAKLVDFATQNHIQGAWLNGIGGFSQATLGYFDNELKDYRPVPLTGQMELVSFIGNIGPFRGEPRVHVHVVVATAESVRGGHLLDARVRPTLEVVLVELPARLEHVLDERTGLPLLRP